jgi:hypothetical protein
MTGNSLIQIALALSVLYTLFSLLISVLNEWVSRWWGIRRKFLHEELDRLLGAELAAGMRSHPLFKGQRAGAEEGNDPSDLSPQVFALIFLDLTVDFVPSPTPGYPGSVSIKSSLCNPESVTLAKSVIMHSSNLDAIQARVMKWFELSMEQVSGRYKRAIQIVNVLFAFVICAAGNLDTARIAWALYFHDPKVYPIGWPGNIPQSAVDFLTRIPGILISTGAISLGAPFWFDMINKLVNLRQTGLPSDENPVAKLTAQ